MSLENILATNTLKLYVNGVVNGIDPSTGIAEFNSASIGCIENSATATIDAAIVSGGANSFVNIEVQWALGPGHSTTSNTFLQFSSVLPANFIPPKEKTLYGQVNLNGVNVPAYLDVGTDGVLTVRNSADGGGAFPSGQQFFFSSISGCYSLAA